MLRRSACAIAAIAVLFNLHAPETFAWQKSSNRTLARNGTRKLGGQPSIGVFFSDPASENRRISGVVVDSVWKNGPADKAGLRIDDVIVSAKRKLVRSARQLERIIASARPGRPMSIRIKRPMKRNSGTVVFKSVRMSVTPAPLIETLVASSEIVTTASLKRSVIRFLSLAKERDPDSERLAIVYTLADPDEQLPGIVRYELALGPGSKIQIPDEGSFTIGMLFVNPFNGKLGTGGYLSIRAASVIRNTATKERVIHVAGAKRELFTRVYKLAAGGVSLKLPGGPETVLASSFDIRQMKLIRSLIGDLPKVGEYVRKQKKTK